MFCSARQDDIVSSDQEEFQEYVRVFAPVYMHLVEVMLTKVQYPPDEEYSTWNAGRVRGQEVNVCRAV